MGDPLRVYTPRERLSAATVNELTKAERARRAARLDAPIVPGLNLTSVRVLIRNSSGDDIDQFAVLGIGGLAITRDENQDDFDGGDHVILDGVTPEEESSSAAGHVGKFAVVQQPLADGEIGIAIVGGVTKVQIDVQDEDDQFADVADGDETQLKSGGSGAARILWKEEASGSSDGTVWAVVLIGGSGGGRGYFPVWVVKTAGVNGGQTTAATFQYSAYRDSTESDLLGEDLTPVRARPRGELAIYGPSGGWGVGFYDGSTFKLWSANEIYGTGDCSI